MISREYVYIGDDHSRIGIAIDYSGANDLDRGVIYFPGRWQNSKLWANNVDLDIRLFLAKRGFTVATLDYRAHFLNKDPLSLEALRTVELSDMIDDVHRAKYELFRRGWKKVALIGFSFGAALSLLSYTEDLLETVCFVALDGGFRANDIKDLCTNDDGRTAGDDGILISPTAGALKRHLESLQRGLQGNCPIPQKTLALIPGLKRCNRDVVNLLLNMDVAWPAAVVSETNFIATAQARDVLVYLERINRFSAPILAVMSTNKVGTVGSHPAMISAGHTGSNNISHIWLPSWGHLEILCGEKVIECVNQPVLSWLTSVF